MKSVSIVSLGCPKNLVDSERVLGALSKDYRITFDVDNADIVIINTCAFLKESREESESVIKEFLEKKRKGKIKKVVVLGCYPSLDLNGLKEKFKEVDAFVGTNNLKDVEKAISDNRDFVSSKPEFSELPRLQVTLPHYSYLKIADGCNHRCAFCLIPKIKGNLHSFDINFLVNEAKALAENGVKELILIAQDTTQYGLDIYGTVKLIELLKELENIEGIKWIRLLYTYPSPYMFELVRFIRDSKKVVPYIDMPIQHASDRVLRSMLRGSSKKELESIASFIKDNGITFRTSVIVGFPGETKEDFKQLKDFLSTYEVDHIGIFKYSNEEGTLSYSLEQVPREEIEERFEELNNLKDELALKRSRAFIGKEVEFIVDYYDRSLHVSVGRSIFDAPDIDNVVFVKKVLTPSNIYSGEVKEADRYEWYLEVKK